MKGAEINVDGRRRAAQRARSQIAYAEELVYIGHSLAFYRS